MGMADLVTKLGLSVVVILWVLATFTRELREIIRLMQTQAQAQAATQKTLEALLALSVREDSHKEK